MFVYSICAATSWVCSSCLGPPSQKRCDGAWVSTKTGYKNMNIDKNMEHSKLQRSTLYIKFKYPGEQEEVSKVVLLVQAYQQPIVCFFSKFSPCHSFCGLCNTIPWLFTTGTNGRLKELFVPGGTLPTQSVCSPNLWACDMMGLFTAYIHRSYIYCIHVLH